VTYCEPFPCPVCVTRLFYTACLSRRRKIDIPAGGHIFLNDTRYSNANVLPINARVNVADRNREPRYREIPRLVSAGASSFRLEIGRHPRRTPRRTPRRVARENHFPSDSSSRTVTSSRGRGRGKRGRNGARSLSAPRWRSTNLLGKRFRELAPGATDETHFTAFPTASAYSARRPLSLQSYRHSGKGGRSRFAMEKLADDDDNGRGTVDRR